MLTGHTCQGIGFEDHAHRCAALVRTVDGRAVIDEGGSLTLSQLVVAHKEMNRDAQGSVLDDFLAARTAGCGAVLALPLEGVIVDPVIDVAMFLGLALFVQCDQQHMRAS